MNETTARPTRHAPPPTEEAVYTAAPAENLPAATTPIYDTVPERADTPQEVLPANGPGAVIEAIAKIMAEAKPIEKAGWNNFQKYAHVRMQDISATLTPLMGKHGIVIFQDEVGREMFDSGNVIAIRYRFTMVHMSGAIWPQQPVQTGVSRCRNTKDGFDDKAMAKAHTAARKYFLLSLFQLASEDMEDADNEGKPPQRSSNQNRPRSRPAPSPSGKFSPHKVPVLFDEAAGENEEPAKWAVRFLEFVAKAESKAEIDDWYDQNERLLTLIKERRDPVYDQIIERMDAREAELLAPEKPQDTPKPAAVTKTDDPPATKQPASSGDPGDIPEALKRPPRRRTAPPPEAKPALTDDEREWIEGLEGIFSGCPDMETLNEAFQTHIEPNVAKYSALAVDKATAAYNTAADKLGG